MTVKEMREQMDMTQDILARRYRIPKEAIVSWESGKEAPPPDMIEMLENALKHYIPRTAEEVMSLPLTVVELRDMCDRLIERGFAEKSVLLSNDTAETGYHGMYYGFGDEEEDDTYITLN